MSEVLMGLWNIYLGQQWEHWQSSIPFPVVQELKDTKQFEEMSNSTDEDEHSIELHLPYIAKVMERYLHFDIILGYFT